MNAYRDFIDTKSQANTGDGFRTIWMPDNLFDFQKYLTDWMCWRGRSGAFADCGMGKSPMQLTWAENVVRHTNRHVLLATPLAVGPQMVAEGEKFGVQCHLSRDGKFPSTPQVVVTNYERLHYFNSRDFSGMSGDESGILKNFDGTRKAEITEFMRTMPYRLLCTATVAPNDYVELGTHSEALGELGYMDMLSKFFKNDQGSNHPNRNWAGGKWRFRGHSEQDFWRYVCSWARALRRPSDLGFKDGGFDLPPLHMEEHIVEARFAPPGRLFSTLALTQQEQTEDRRRTIEERCEKAAALLCNTGMPGVAWCHLNPEGDLLEKLIPDAIQISGADSDEVKEERFAAFIKGEVRVLVTKEKIGGYGLNLQHCSHMTTFPSHSFEQFYQSIRRFWRFGQQNPVKVDMVASEAAMGVLANLKRKSDQADVMFERLIAHMGEALSIQRKDPFQRKAEVPEWL